MTRLSKLLRTGAFCLAWLPLVAHCGGPATSRLSEEATGEEQAAIVNVPNIDLSQCPPDIQCPAENLASSLNCNQHRFQDKNPPAPQNCPKFLDSTGRECFKVVFGQTNEITKLYGCADVVVLNAKNYSVNLNDDFTRCAILGKMGNKSFPLCDNGPIGIATPQNSIPNAASLDNAARTTAQELCQMAACGLDVTWEYTAYNKLAKLP